MATITKDDVNAARAGADSLGDALLQREINGVSLLGRDYYYIYIAVIDLSVKNNWKIHNEDIGKAKFRKLLDICLDLYVNPKRCTRCNGTGQNVRFRQCGKCGGGGYVDTSDKELSERMGVNTRLWYRVWKKRKNQVMGLLRERLPDHETKALRHILGRLKQ